MQSIKLPTPPRLGFKGSFLIALGLTMWLGVYVNDFCREKAQGLCDLFPHPQSKVHGPIGRMFGSLALLLVFLFSFVGLFIFVFYVLTVVDGVPAPDVSFWHWYVMVPGMATVGLFLAYAMVEAGELLSLERSALKV